MTENRRKWWRAGVAASALLLGVTTLGAGADASLVQDQDRAQKASERAARDAARLEERVIRDQERYLEDRAKILQRNLDDPVRQQEELAKLEADRVEDLTRYDEESAKIAEDLADELNKAATDDAEREDRFQSLAEDNVMRDVGQEENPEFDRRGFPVRRGEIVALNLEEAEVNQLRSRGFSLVAQQELPALVSHITRLETPDGLDVNGSLDLARSAVPEGTFDYTHYYAMQYNSAGFEAGGSAKMRPPKKDKLTIGMIDTGVAAHTTLGGTSVHERSFGAVSSAPVRGHGTAVASILANEGTENLFVADVFRGRDSDPFTSADAVIDALEWLAASNIRVVNMSLAGPRNLILDKLIERSAGRGMVIVAAAGNGGPTAAPAYPAALPNVVAVTAVDNANRVYRYANQGNYITVSARGVAEPAADANGGIRTFSGTSFATPHVTAWMGRCMKKKDAVDCARTLRKDARDLGAPGYDKVYGFGLIQ